MAQAPWVCPGLVSCKQGTRPGRPGTGSVKHGEWLVPDRRNSVNLGLHLIHILQMFKSLIDGESYITHRMHWQSEWKSYHESFTEMRVMDIIYCDGRESKIFILFMSKVRVLTFASLQIVLWNKVNSFRDLLFLRISFFSYLKKHKIWTKLQRPPKFADCMSMRVTWQM